jgi:hypothetical protein
MTEMQVLDIIRAEAGRVVDMRNPKIAEALRRAARRIVSDAQTDQRHAARTASQVGYMVTRGRTRL